MKFTSTRSRQALSASEVLVKGIAADGGLFVPERFPVLDEDFVKKLIPMSYRDRAAAVLPLYLDDFTADEIRTGVDGAYSGTFDNDDPAPLKEVDKDMHLLELWHGPTCAFKDMALQLLPYLLTAAAKRCAPGWTLVILTATSGDTGKAALAGFADVPGVKIAVFYPRDGVSAMQKLQMTTQTGNNVTVCGIEGNFDDAQNGVKAIFTDPEMRQYLADRKLQFSSANSINFGRLVPQVVYYISAWCDLLKTGKLKAGETFNVTVPTGNFGNILAAWYAKQMGVPIGKFICASNRNNVLSDFIATGIYDRNREFYTTDSPSMDILISSNLERLLYHLSGNDPEEVANLMQSLKDTGRYQVKPELLAGLRQDFWGASCDDRETAAAIGELFREKGYLMDTHTAVAVHVYKKYLRETGDDRPCVIASTASPFKFAPAVLPAVADGVVPEDEFAVTQMLSDVSQCAIPGPLASLKGREVLHRQSIAKEDMPEFIRNFL
ncbi:MAG: threonine synthase [Lentisphaeria bacterium]|nr:threonine synthase [Lentisphaeria bacterium]